MSEPARGRPWPRAGPCQTSPSWPHRKRHAAPFCREPRPTKARVRQRGGLLTRPPSRGRERQFAPRRHAEPSHMSPRGSSTVRAMDPWILEPQTAGETRIFLESWPLSFLRAGPPKSRKKAGESRTHPNLETNFAKLTPGPTRGLTARCLRTLCLFTLFIGKGDSPFF